MQHWDTAHFCTDNSMESGIQDKYIVLLVSNQQEKLFLFNYSTW